MAKYCVLVNVYSIGGFGRRFFRDAYEFLVDEVNEETFEKLKEQSLEKFLKGREKNYSKVDVVAATHQVMKL